MFALFDILRRRRRIDAGVWPPKPYDFPLPSLRGRCRRPSGIYLQGYEYVPALMRFDKR